MPKLVVPKNVLHESEREEGKRFRGVPIANQQLRNMKNTSEHLSDLEMKLK